MDFVKVVAIAGLSGTLAFAGTAIAQEAEATPEAAPAPMEQELAPAAEFSDEQLQAFATAYIAVTEVAMGYEQRMLEAQSDEDMIALQMQAQDEMVAAVEAVEGIDVDQYSLIFDAVQADPELGARVQAIIEEQMS